MSEITEIQKKKLAEDFLKGYRLNQRLLRMEQYENKYFATKNRDIEFLGEMPLARARMYEIRHFVSEMKNSDEKLLLYYHYIKGESVEKCAELFGMSRSSAFRLKGRALLLAYEKMTNKTA